MRSDVLSKRLFYVGCFGLPWLWTVHVLHHWKGGVSPDGDSNDEALLNPDDRTYNQRRYSSSIFIQQFAIR